MLVQCLGSGDAFGSGGKFNTCFYIKTTDLGILLDCGATSSVALKKARKSPEDIDLIIITHFHGDHFGGVPFFLCEAKVGTRRTKPLTIAGPEGLKEKVIQGLDLFFPTIASKGTFALDFVSYAIGRKTIVRNVEITAWRAIHSEETNPHSVRIKVDNKIIAYSGDTEWNDDLLSVSEGADLFICEGSGYDKPITSHMTVKQLVENRKRITAKKIVLTHLGAEALSHLSEIPFAVAGDGDVLLDGSN
jgi:ribonuclease BN (tRNA processing enzyme)